VEVSVSRGEESSAPISQQIVVQAAWTAITPLPEGAQVHLALESLSPLRGEIFVLAQGSQQQVVSFIEIGKPQAKTSEFSLRVE